MTKYLLRTTTFTFLLATMILAAACKKDPLPHQPTDNSNSEPETSITFTATKDSFGLSGVFIGITPNEADRDNGIFLKSGTTTGSGRKTFDELDADTWYYQATYAQPGGPAVRKGSITLEIGDEVDRELNF